MKIFSYISRELPDSTFRCNVFKAYKKVSFTYNYTDTESVFHVHVIHFHVKKLHFYVQKVTRCCLSVVMFLCLFVSDVIQNMALHIVRSLGQAFDVCHRLNPRPKKTKKEGEEGEGEGEKAENGETTGEGGTEDGKGAVANGSPELGADLSAALMEISLNEGEKKAEPAPSSNLIGLDFDPFSFNFETPAQPNGAPQAGLDSAFSGGGAEAAFPPLMVSNNPSGFPELPVGTAAAQTQLHLMGRPRPRPTPTSNQQVSVCVWVWVCGCVCVCGRAFGHINDTGHTQSSCFTYLCTFTQSSPPHIWRDISSCAENDSLPVTHTHTLHTEHYPREPIH